MKKNILAACLFITNTISAIAQDAPLQDGLALKYVVQEPAIKTTQIPVIILLHGYGSNEQDLFGLKSAFPANFLIVAARAPYPAGSAGFQWFEIGSVNSATTDKNVQVEKSKELITRFITQVTKKYKADPKQVYIAGFSQGAMMSYAVGLTHPEMVRGIGVLSGRLFPYLKKEVKNTPALKQLKIFISHGTDDDRIKFTDGKDAGDFLLRLGLKPEFHAYKGMGHTISDAVLKDFLSWLK